MDQQIYALTDADEVEDDIATADEIFVAIQDTLTLNEHRINVLRRQLEAMQPSLRPANQDPVGAPLARFYNGKSLKQKFSGIQLWPTSTNLTILEPNVLVTVAGLTPSNEN